MGKGDFEGPRYSIEISRGYPSITAQCNKIIIGRDVWLIEWIKQASNFLSIPPIQYRLLRLCFLSR